MSFDMMDPVVIGPYTILDLLGEGGASSVYLARRDSTMMTFALKAVHVAQEASQKDQDQMRREILVMEKLRHPNVIRLWDAGYDGEWLYYAMDHCERGSLDQHMDTHRRLELTALLGWATGVALGTAHLHEKGIIHRDLKPANVLLSNDLEPKLSDFGIARLPEDARDPDGLRIGTPRYMAPEVREGGDPTLASDVFQLGLIFYRMVTGVEFHKAHKTSGFTRGATVRNFLAPSRFNEDSPPELDQLILDCLHPDPAERPASAQQVVERLTPIAPREARAPDPTGS